MATSPGDYYYEGIPDEEIRAIRECSRRDADKAPPLRDEQKTRLRQIFSPSRATGGAVAGFVVWRHYDVDDRLLFVGDDPDEVRNAGVSRFVAHHEPEYFTEGNKFEAEKRIVEDEQPPFNAPGRACAKYLAERQAWDLLVPVTRVSRDASPLPHSPGVTL